MLCIGPRLCLRLDGSDNRNDFWSLVDSEDIHPYGWCEEQGEQLQPPLGMCIEFSGFCMMLCRLLLTPAYFLFANVAFLGQSEFTSNLFEPCFFFVQKSKQARLFLSNIFPRAIDNKVTKMGVIMRPKMSHSRASQSSDPSVYS